MEDAKQILKEKIAYLEKEHAICADAIRKFALKKNIQEAEKELHNLNKKTKNKYYTLITITTSIILLIILLYSILSPKLDIKISKESLWSGTWEQEHSGKGKKSIKGQIIFNDSLQSFKMGRYFNFTGNSKQVGIIYDITFSKNGYRINGKWKNLSTLQKGNCYFILDSLGNSFNGKYSMSIDEEPQYYWKGTRDMKQ